MRNLLQSGFFPARTCALLLVILVAMLFLTSTAGAQIDSVSVQTTESIVEKEKVTEFGVYVSAIDVIYLVSGDPSLHVSARYHPLQSIIVLNPSYIRFTERYNFFLPSKNLLSPYIGFEIGIGGDEETRIIPGLLLGFAINFSHRYALEIDIDINQVFILPNLKLGIHF